MYNACFDTGLDLLVAQRFAPLRGKRVGLVTHPAAVDAQFRSAVDLIATAEGVKLVTILGPKHGLHGQAQDLISVAGKRSIIAGTQHGRIHSGFCPFRAK